MTETNAEEKADGITDEMIEAAFKARFGYPYPQPHTVFSCTEMLAIKRELVAVLPLIAREKNAEIEGLRAQAIVIQDAQWKAERECNALSAALSNAQAEVERLKRALAINCPFCSDLRALATDTLQETRE